MKTFLAVYLPFFHACCLVVHEKNYKKSIAPLLTKICFLQSVYDAVFVINETLKNPVTPGMVENGAELANGILAYKRI